MTNLICLDERYSTTRQLSNVEPQIGPTASEKFESLCFLKENEERKSEGGLRTAGYYKNTTLTTPLLTIITAVFNGSEHIEETILSVINQTYDNVEFIIIDGGSTDATLDIIKKYEHAIDYWVSEPDEGISDAFNKGVRVANGDFINFQGDGDGFYANDSLENIIRDVNSAEDMLVSGRIQRVNVDGAELYVSNVIPKFHKKTLLFRMSLPHQGLFTNIKYFKQYGLFDVNNTYCMDYEHLLRAYAKFPCVVTKNVIVAKWRADGLGNNRDLDIFKEYHKIKLDNKIASFPILFGINLWTLFKFHMKKVIK